MITYVAQTLHVISSNSVVHLTTWHEHGYLTVKIGKYVLTRTGAEYLSIVTEPNDYDFMSGSEILFSFK